jgi:hypothetical protein
MLKASVTLRKNIPPSANSKSNYVEGKLRGKFYENILRSNILKEVIY